MFPLKKNSVSSGAPRYLPRRPPRPGGGCRARRLTDSRRHRGHNLTEVSLGQKGLGKGVSESAGPALCPLGAEAQAAAFPPRGSDASEQGGQQESLAASSIRDQRSPTLPRPCHAPGPGLGRPSAPQPFRPDLQPDPHIQDPSLSPQLPPQGPLNPGLGTTKFGAQCEEENKDP